MTMPTPELSVPVAMFYPGFGPPTLVPWMEPYIFPISYLLGMEKELGKSDSEMENNQRGKQLSVQGLPLLSPREAYLGQFHCGLFMQAGPFMKST